MPKGASPTPMAERKPNWPGAVAEADAALERPTAEELDARGELADLGELGEVRKEGVVDRGAHGAASATWARTSRMSMLTGHWTTQRPQPTQSAAPSRAG